jgi:hypothetical protein
MLTSERVASSCDSTKVISYGEIACASESDKLLLLETKIDIPGYSVV